MSEGEVSGKDSEDFTSCLNMLLFIQIKKYKKETFKKKNKLFLTYLIIDLIIYLNKLLSPTQKLYWPYLDKLSPQPNFKDYDQLSCHKVYTYEIIFSIYFQVQIVVSAPGNGDNFKSRTMKQSGNVYVYNTRSQSQCQFTQFFH